MVVCGRSIRTTAYALFFLFLLALFFRREWRVALRDVEGGSAEPGDLSFLFPEFVAVGFASKFVRYRRLAAGIVAFPCHNTACANVILN